MCKGLWKKKRKNFTQLYSYSMNENYSGRRHYHLSRTTLKSFVWSYFDFVHCVNYIFVVKLWQQTPIFTSHHHLFPILSPSLMISLPLDLPFSLLSHLQTKANLAPSLAGHGHVPILILCSILGGMSPWLAC